MEVAYPDLVGHTGSMGVHKSGLKPIWTGSLNHVQNLLLAYTRKFINWI